MGSRSKSEEQWKQMDELSKTLKEGEKILPPTRRPDGSLRKPRKVRAGYDPPDEAPKYKSRGALWKEAMASQTPPGFEPESPPKPKTKSSKRNERKKEKRLQAVAEKDKNPEEEEASEPITNSSNGVESVSKLTSGMEALAVSSSPTVASPSSNQVEACDSGTAGEDIDKKIRALKKKIRLTEAQQQKTAPQDLKPEQIEKFAKLEEWRKEVKAMEDKKAELVGAST